MSGWTSDVSKSGHDALGAVNAQLDQRQRDYSLGDGSFFGPASFIKKYNVVGIKADQVKNICESIRKYVSDVDTYLADVLEADKDAAKVAFRGEEALTAIKQYLDKVKDYITNLTSTLLSFSDKVADVGNAWIKAQQTFAETINTSAGNFSEGTKYKEQINYNGSSIGGVGNHPSTPSNPSSSGTRMVQ